MKTLSSNTTKLVDHPRISPIRFIEISFSVGVLRMCDRVFSADGLPCEFDGNFYLPLITSFGSVSSSRVSIPELETSPGSADVTIVNNVRVLGYENAGKLFLENSAYFTTVNIYLGFEELTSSSDLIKIFSGSIENVVDVNEEEIRVTFSSYEIGLNKKFDVKICEEDTYSGADPDDQGKMFPVVYGSAKRVPLLAVDAGSIDSIADAVDASQTTGFYLSDASRFPASGTIQIDSEQITYTNRSGNDLGTVVRGANSTTATAHDKGATAAEIQTNYIYLLGHPVKSINNVYVDGVRATGGYTAYTGQSGDEISGYSGMAGVVFTTRPTLEKQVTLDTDDTIDNDSKTTTNAKLFPNDGGLSTTSGNIPYSAYPASAIWNKTSALNPYCIMTQQNSSTKSWIHFKWQYSQGLYGTQVNQWFYIRAYTNSKVKIQVRIGSSTGTVAGYVPEDNGGYQWYRFELGSYQGQIWYVYIEAQSTDGTTFNENARVSDAYHLMEYIPEVDKTGTVTLTGNSVAETVIGRSISVDVDGFQDDSSGTITGTANALIERPDHIFNHILTQMCSVPTSAINSSSYTSAGNEYNTNNVTLGFALLEKENVLDVLNKIAFQSKSIQWWDSGEHYIKYLSSATSANKTLSAKRIEFKSVNVERTQRAHIENTFNAVYNKYFNGENNSDSITLTDSTSVSTFGALKSPTYSFNYVNDETWARSILDNIDNLKSFPKWIISATVTAYGIDLQVGDLISFEFSHNDDLAKALSRLVWGDDIFRISSVTLKEDFSIAITAWNESDVIVGDSLIDEPFDFSDSTYWGRGNISSVTTGENDPVYGTNGCGIISDSTNGGHYLSTYNSGKQLSVTENKLYTFEIFVKSGNKNYLRVEFYFSTDSGVKAPAQYFNVSTGVVGTMVENGGNVVLSAWTNQENNNFYRCFCVVQAPVGVNYLHVAVYPAEADNNNVFAGDGSTINVYVYKAIFYEN